MRNHESHHHSSSDTSTHAEDTHGHTHGAIDPALLWQSLLERIWMQCWTVSNRFYEIEGESIMPRCRFCGGTIGPSSGGIGSARANGGKTMDGGGYRS